MSDHAKLSPSASARWTTCRASPGLIRANAHRLPADNSTEASKEGTLAHSHAAEALVMGFSADAFADKIMAAHVKTYVEYVDSHVTGDSDLYVEQKVPLWYSPKENGTVDAFVQTETHIHIFDLKYGQGVTVEAEGNTQLAIYAESLIQKLEGVSMDKLVKLHIIQPRAREGDPIKTWELTRRELQDFCENIEEAVRQITAAEREPEFVLPFAPSDKACQFCPVKALCTARAQHLTAPLPEELVKELFAFNFSVAQLSEADIARIAKVSLDGGLVKWLNSVEEYALELVRAGKLEGHGLKAVAGKTHRKWTDEEQVVALLGRKVKKDDLWEMKLASPSKVEKLLKGQILSARFTNRLAELTSKPEGSPALATEDDKRPALQPITAAAEFPPDEDLM